MLYFSENSIRGNHAGTKARNDVENILCSYGCKSINSKKYILTSDTTESIYSNVTTRLGLLKYFLELLAVRNKTVFVQYPMLAFDKEAEYLSKIAQHNHLVLLVHDVHGLKRQNQDEIAREISILNLASAVIVHNRFMEEKLKECGLSVSKIYRLNIFDYLCEERITPNHANENGVAFAGNLGKSEFFSAFCKANPNIPLHLYGQKFDNRLNVFPNIRYSGSFKPDEIPGKLFGKYGLVWDGDSIDTCSGIFGEYTRYNNPHKLSLYLVAGMPVIVWKYAAIAEFVVNNGVGIAVNSLESLEKAINCVSEKDYAAMIKNVMFLKAKLLAGNSLKNILRQVEVDFGR